jgi:uncharacterized protein (TIGR03546 family)
MFWMVRKILSILRGGATPFEVGLAIVLGTLLGFLPGFSLLSVILIALILVLNVPIPLALLAVAVAKGLSFVVEPYTYLVGRMLLKIPPIEQGVSRLVNGPFSAWMDLDRYCTLGGIPVSIAVGIALAIIGASLIWRFRSRMARLEAGSPAFQKWSRKWYVRFITWILFGSRKGAKGRSYSELLEVRTKVFRKWGLILALLFVGLMAAGEYFFAGMAANYALTGALEAYNGATVDIPDVDVSLSGGHFEINRLAMCDPENLSHDSVRVHRIRGDLDTNALASRRFVIDELVLDDVRTHVKRDHKGERFREPPPEPPPPPEPESGTSVYDVIEEAKRWRERLIKVQDWLEQWESEEEAEEPKEPRREELKRIGYRNFRASYLIEDTPRVLIRSVKIKTVRPSVAGVKETYDVEIVNLSDNPRLAGGDPAIRISSKDEKLKAAIRLAFEPERIRGRLALQAKDVDLGKLQKMLKNDNAVQFGSGRADLSIDNGSFGAGHLHVPMAVRIRGMDATTRGDKKLFGLKPEHAKIAFGLLKDVETKITFTGRPAAPGILFDTGGLAESLQQALVANGREMIASELEKQKGRLQKEAQKEVQKHLDKYRKKVPGLDKIDPGKLPGVDRIPGVGDLLKTPDDGTETDDAEEDGGLLDSLFRKPKEDRPELTPAEKARREEEKRRRKEEKRRKKEEKKRRKEEQRRRGE